jgi:4'-phosphopantetheinyl transferase
VPSEQVELWLADPRAIDDDLLDAYRSWLDPGERERLRSLQLQGDRRDFLVGRALARTALTRRHPSVEPARWRFRLGPWGRPELDEPEVEPRPRFNLSHSRGLLACALTDRVDVGVDVERVAPRRFAAIAEDFFAPLEVASLAGLGPEELEERFFALWTLKEAYIKARGMGLAIRLDHFWFSIGPGGEVTLAGAPELGDDGSGWRFGRLRPSEGQRLALAVSTPKKLSVTVRHAVPLVGESAPTFWSP